MSDEDLRSKRQSVIDLQTKEYEEQKRKEDEAAELESRASRRRSTRTDLKRKQLSLFCGLFESTQPGTTQRKSLLSDEAIETVL